MLKGAQQCIEGARSQIQEVIKDLVSNMAWYTMILWYTVYYGILWYTVLGAISHRTVCSSLTPRPIAVMHGLGMSIDDHRSRNVDGFWLNFAHMYIVHSRHCYIVYQLSDINYCFVGITMITGFSSHHYWYSEGLGVCQSVSKDRDDSN